MGTPMTDFQDSEDEICEKLCNLDVYKSPESINLWITIVILMADNWHPSFFLKGSCFWSILTSTNTIPKSLETLV